METVRKPLQGVTNIIRFNWHFYLMAVASLMLIPLARQFSEKGMGLNVIYILVALVIGSTLISLMVSFYIYDLSGLYKLNWLNDMKSVDGGRLVNINAGFDETSALLKNKFPGSQLIALDFYDPFRHTEVSIKRARKAYPPYPKTSHVVTTDLNQVNESADRIFVLFAAHEIRLEDERDAFFHEMKRILKPDGQIIITEHLRDIPNFLAYNIGFFHFLPLSSWQRSFRKAGLYLISEKKITPFISTFILQKHGATH